MSACNNSSKVCLLCTSQLVFEAGARLMNFARVEFLIGCGEISFVTN